MYHIRVENPQGINGNVERIILNGKTLKGNAIPLVDKPREHVVTVFLGEKRARRI
jgi:cellobiose phosphorylase